MYFRTYIYYYYIYLLSCLKEKNTFTHFIQLQKTLLDILIHEPIAMKDHS